VVLPMAIGNTRLIAREQEFQLGLGLGFRIRF